MRGTRGRVEDNLRRVARRHEDIAANPAFARTLGNLIQVTQIRRHQQSGAVDQVSRVDQYQSAAELVRAVDCRGDRPLRGWSAVNRDEDWAF